MKSELQCMLNCGSDDCNGQCPTWNEIKSALVLLSENLDATFSIVSLLESLDADRRLIKYAQSLCSRDFMNIIQEGKRDIASGIDFVDILSGNEFELLISELYTAMGYSVKKTAQTRDGGIDIIAEKFDECFLIQCKRYSPKRKVTINVVRELNGVINVSSTVNKGIIISSTGFTKPAENFATKSQIQLFDRKDVERMLNTSLFGELPGFRIKSGNQSVSNDEIVIYLTLINTSERDLTQLQVVLQMFDENEKKIDEVLPYNSTDQLEGGKSWDYKFVYAFPSQINYYKIFIKSKRKGESQIKNFQGSKHYLNGF